MIHNLFQPIGVARSHSVMSFYRSVSIWILPAMVVLLAVIVEGPKNASMWRSQVPTPSTPHLHKATAMKGILQRKYGISMKLILKLQGFLYGLTKAGRAKLCKVVAHPASSALAREIKSTLRVSVDVKGKQEVFRKMWQVYLAKVLFVL